MRTILDSEEYWLIKRKKAAWRNIIIIISIMIIIMIYFGVGTFLVNKSKTKTKERMVELGEVVKSLQEKKLLTKREELDLLKKGGRVIPLNENIIMKCISGKKAIIVNGEIYYAGDLDTWGDIKGVDCE